MLREIIVRGAASITWEHVYFENLDIILNDLTRGAMFSVSMSPPPGEDSDSR